MSGNQGGGSATAPGLNPALRPQRLYAKIEICIKIVDKKLRHATTIPLLLSADELKDFRKTVRGIIRRD